ncbi:tetratricopeptide repeat protein [Microvirga sp. CF3062]|uniref:tetratricopeptide repeat protein n=1 Tax=Microvirga sp. CF3062 TaxID=3110182 RepID=UPI002E7A4D61|nr:tetratricopeptide repeat protein [Microvirga sp. CF3062]MEE1658079.1 tetratricopeptide repeat protein [Microvirga sp. CF3062]
MKKLVPLLVWLLAAAVPTLAQAQKAEVAPGISVTRKTYRVPDNEAPFFNFADKNEAQKAADKKLVDAVLERVPDRTRAAGTAIDAGMRAFLSDNDFATAAKRFNQAYLLHPQHSGVYHGFALVAAARFKDFGYADELFRLAARMKSPAPPLAADHGRTLLIAGRPAEAKALLEQAVKDTPGWAVPRMNLAWAALQTGNRAEACRLITQVKGQDLESVERDLALFKQKAGC